MGKSSIPENTLGFLLHDVSRLMRRSFNGRAQDLGLTQAQCRVLAHLARNEGIQQVALADILEVQPITLARLLDRLEAAGLIERRDDPRDRRVFRLHLTEIAKPLLAQIHRLGTEMTAEATAGISTADLKQLLRSLGTMKRNLLEAEAATPAVSETESYVES